MSPSMLLGSAKIGKLCPGGTKPDLATVIEMATAEVEGALVQGGYTGGYPETKYDVSASDCPKLIKLAAIGAFLELAYGLNELELPKEFAAYIQKIESIRKGDLEIPNVPKDTGRAIGGVLPTETTPGATGARPPVFSRSRDDGSNPMGGY